MCGRLIVAGFATLHELKTVYTLEDAYALDEALYLKNYHEWLVNKQAVEEARNG
nr:MAG TPA: hypothetical protein [Caudoviricetes sp.]